MAYLEIEKRAVNEKKKDGGSPGNGEDSTLVGNVFILKRYEMEIQASEENPYLEGYSWMQQEWQVLENGAVRLTMHDEHVVHYLCMPMSSVSSS